MRLTALTGTSRGCLAHSSRRCTVPVLVARPVTGPGRSRVLLAAVAAPEQEKPAPATPAKAQPHWKQVLSELDTPKDAPSRKVVICQVAPAVRVSISECFGLPPGACTPGQLAEGLRRLGFETVFDTLFGADVTIMEEASELLHRVVENLEGTAGGHEVEALPMFTSCCPGWIALVEKSYPEIIPYISSTKSPQLCLGALAKTYLAELRGIKPADICMVSIMPCTRKQSEADREWMCSSAPGVRDVDHVITTAELGNIFKERGINLPELPEGGFDQPLGEGTGAAQLFGSTGGVMEAALRTAYEFVTGEPLDRLAYAEVRGLDGIKEATVTMKPAPGTKLAELLKARKASATAAVAAIGAKQPVVWDGGSVTEAGDALRLRVAVANGLGNAKKLVGKMQAGESKYDFVEVMACPAGCVGGGGQPRSTDKQITQKRQQAIYSLDERMTVRRSHQNAAVQKVYADYLGQPLSHKAHDLLHTYYVPGGPEGGDSKE